MASNSEPGVVRRKCNQCGTRNVVEVALIGTRCRCAECGGLLYPEEVPGYVPPPRRVEEYVRSSSSAAFTDALAGMLGFVLIIGMILGAVYIGAKILAAHDRPGAELKIRL
jgi:hypothetical protein